MTAIEGATVLVTGGDRGISTMLVKELHGRGAGKVYATTRDPRTVTHPDPVPLGLAANRLFLLTHPAVITYTARTPNDQLPDVDSPIVLVQTNRGGHATHHGPAGSSGASYSTCANSVLVV